ncbi:hypothetical protein GGX14DRAFT_402169 [Mycena pura]|uniref:Uncharacterized protein n=1 Tax=Mycena pura TaxID=153505 RepID=A0AAD6UYE1_9AGAR|nr:hypothetical protein GGX14DRAFT_402169 [Mycena pura]
MLFNFSILLTAAMATAAAAVSPAPNTDRCVKGFDAKSIKELCGPRTNATQCVTNKNECPGECRCHISNCPVIDNGKPVGESDGVHAADDCCSYSPRIASQLLDLRL